MSFGLMAKNATLDQSENAKNRQPKKLFYFLHNELRQIQSLSLSLQVFFLKSSSI